MAIKSTFQMLLLGLAVVAMAAGATVALAADTTSVQPEGHKCKNLSSCEAGTYRCTANCGPNGCSCTIS